MYPEQLIPTDPSLPPAADMAVWYPSYYCDCRWPVREERAERRGAARTYCVRCDREIPLKLGLAGVSRRLDGGDPRGQVPALPAPERA